MHGVEMRKTRSVRVAEKTKDKLIKKTGTFQMAFDVGAYLVLRLSEKEIKKIIQEIKDRRENL